jgi:hypothetical protein
MLTRFLVIYLSVSSSVQGGQYIVELLSASKNRAASADAEVSLTRRGAKVMERTERTLNTLISEIDDADLYAVATNPAVKRIYPVVLYKPAADVIDETQAIAQAWERVGGREQAGAGIRIGILDTGIDETHPGFTAEGMTAPDGYPRVDSAKNWRHTSAKVIVARSYERFNARSFGNDATDVYGHGTATAMIAGGVRHDNTGGSRFSGMAPRAYLGNYKVIGDDAVATSAGVLKAIDDAVADGMDVINLSLGTAYAPRPEDDVIVQALERAVDMGVIVVVAAGNAGPGLNSISSPGTAPRAITVGSHSFADGTVAWFSGRGPNLGSGLKPEVVAVGDQFFTADTLQRAGSTGYRLLSGTSFSAPMAAGLAALVKASRPGLTVMQYRSLLVNSASAMPSNVMESGAGKLETGQALSATLTATPAALKFAGHAETLTIESVSGAAGVCSINVEAHGAAPGVSSTQFLAEGPVSLLVEPPAAAGEGYLTVSCEGAPQALRIPFWNAEGVREADSITTIELPSRAPRGATVTFGIRVVDAQGLVVEGAWPWVSVSGGSVTRSGWSGTAPGIYQVTMRVQGDVRVRLSSGAAHREAEVRAY